MNTPAFALGLTLLLPFVSAALALGIRIAIIRECALFMAAIALLANVMNLVQIYADGTSVELILFSLLPSAPLAFRIEPLGLVFAAMASFLWVASCVYAAGYLRANHEKHQRRFWFFYSLGMGAALCVAFSGNLATLFVSYELLTLCTWPLVTHHGDKAARKAGRTYLGILMGASVLLFLPAVVWVYSLSGTLDFAQGGIIPPGKIGPVATGVLLLLFVFGTAKAALMPLHKWLPAAMVAPTPVSALLHAVAVVKAGVFTIMKIVIYVFGVDFLKAQISMFPISGAWLVWVAGFTMVAASWVALRQDNLKRLLAYSTVAQLSYIVLATALLTPKALMAATFHLVAHGFAKITLFFAAGNIYTAAHKTHISQLSGIGRRMPVTMICFAIGALSLIGLPPLAGFISKFYLLTGAFDGEMRLEVLALVLISTMLNASYFLPIIHKAFFTRLPKESDEHGEAPASMLVAISLTALAVVLLFCFPDVVLFAGLLLGGGR